MDRVFGSSIFLAAIALAVSAPAAAVDNGAPLPDWTVVTMASDGSWGVATDRSVAHAIAAAIRDCRASATAIDCGAQLAVSRGGWILAHLCGDRTIIETRSTLGEAEQAVRARTIALKTLHAPDLPPCRHVLSVDPRGAIQRGDALASRGR